MNKSNHHVSIPSDGLVLACLNTWLLSIWPDPMTTRWVLYIQVNSSVSYRPKVVSRSAHLSHYRNLAISAIACMWLFLSGILGSGSGSTCIGSGQNCGSSWMNPRVRERSWTSCSTATFLLWTVSSQSILPSNQCDPPYSAHGGTNTNAPQSSVKNSS